MIHIEFIQNETNPVKAMAMKMCVKGSKERKEAEKMMGCKFEEMTQEQAVLAAEILSAFNGLWQAL